ncbi:MAG TPA: diguanylate cyclase, partial [Bacilli bacterium]
MNDTNRIKVLLIEDNPGDTRLIQEALPPAKDAWFDVTCVDMLKSGIELLAQETFDAVLLDLSLPDSEGLETILAVRGQAPVIPIVVLTGFDDETTALRAVQYGAQDYIIKGQVNSTSIMRSVRYAIERNRLQGELYNLAIVDELTGLYNRRGFYILAEREVNLVNKTATKFILVSADLDGMKQINDTFGHSTGDLALVDITHILKETFSNSHIIARMGGDEFFIIFSEEEMENWTIEQIEQVITDRLRQNLNNFNARS